MDISRTQGVKKKGPRIVKYANLFDLIVLVFVMRDWIAGLISDFWRTQFTNPSCFKIMSLYAFKAFSWRTLLVTLIGQKWQFKIIAPILETWVVIGYAVSLIQDTPTFLIMRGLTQSVNIILIVYCEDKMKCKLMRTNIEQEKWMQMNNFILNDIPENIIILDLKGEVKFISE